METTEIGAAGAGTEPVHTLWPGLPSDAWKLLDGIRLFPLMGPIPLVPAALGTNCHVLKTSTDFRDPQKGKGPIREDTLTPPRSPPPGFAVFVLSLHRVNTHPFVLLLSYRELPSYLLLGLGNPLSQQCPNPVTIVYFPSLLYPITPPFPASYSTASVRGIFFLIYDF